MLLNRPEITWKDDEKYVASILEGWVDWGDPEFGY